MAYSQYDVDGNTNDTFAGTTALCLIIIISYSAVVLYFDRIGFAYMVKRIVYASVLATSYQHLEYVFILIAL